MTKSNRSDPVTRNRSQNIHMYFFGNVCAALVFFLGCENCCSFCRAFEVLFLYFTSIHFLLCCAALHCECVLVMQSFKSQVEYKMQLFYFVVHKFIMVFIEFKYASDFTMGQCVGCAFLF